MTSPDPTRYRVYIRGRDLRRAGELTHWTRLNFVRQFNGVGTWELETSGDSIEARLLTKKGGIVVTQTLEGEEVTIFSGLVWTEFGWTTTTFRASGYSDEALLWEPSRPNPTLASPPWPQDAWVLTGTPSSVMRELVSQQIGPAAPVGPRVPALILGTDPIVGNPVIGRAEFLQPVIEALQSIANTDEAGGLGFALIQSDTTPNAVEFKVYVPENKTDEVKFSVDLGSVSAYEDVTQAPDANHLFVMGGDGLKTRRTVVEVENADSIEEWGRISRVVDRRGVTDPAELAQQANELIAGSATRRRTAVTPFDVPSLQVGVDYDLGSVVTVVTPGGAFADVVTQIEYKLDPVRGAVVTPVVGQGNGGDEERLTSVIHSVQTRVSNLERNWDVPEESINLPRLAVPARIPIGQIGSFAGLTAPVGWVIADGQAINRTTYADLFAYIGTGYGAGNGTTTFNVPDLRDRILVGGGGSFGIGTTAAVVADHTHPGEHDHEHDHTHETDIDHNHPSFTSGSGDGDTGATHTHTVNPPALGSTDVESNNASPDTTDPASTAFAASPVGAAVGSMALLACIYHGVG